MISSLQAPNLEELSIIWDDGSGKSECFYHIDERFRRGKSPGKSLVHYEENGIAKFVYMNCPKLKVFNGMPFDRSVIEVTDLGTANKRFSVDKDVSHGMNCVINFNY